MEEFDTQHSVSGTNVLQQTDIAMAEKNYNVHKIALNF